MNYEEARVYLDEISKYGSVLGLENMKELLVRLGNPQEDLKFIHISGTNGKGSVLAYLSTILSGAGYRTGRYISPTLFSYRERIQVDEKEIEKESLARHVTAISEAVKDMAEQHAGTPTIFEVETALAFLYFKEKKCDVVVLEAWRGSGRYQCDYYHTFGGHCLYQYGPHGISGRYPGENCRAEGGHY